MGLFDKKVPQGPTVEQRIADLETVAKGLGEKMDTDVKEIHEALNILDEDVLDMKNSLPGKVTALELKVADLAKVIEDMKVFGRLAVQLKEEVDELKHIIVNNGLHIQTYEKTSSTLPEKRLAVAATLQEKIQKASKEAEELQTK